MTEVLIIGGGIIGLSLARELKRKGLKQVTILEKNSMCGAEASNAAAGMLAPQAEADKLDDFFRFCAESRDLYENFAAELFVETGVDIELNKSGTLYLALTEIDSEEIVQRYQRQKNAGLKVDLLSANDAKRFEPFVSTDVRESLFFPDDWQVENRKLIHALDKFAEFNEMEIFENTEIKSLIIENCKIIGADTGIEKFYAEKVVLTAG
ncbi:MAG TPA: FAD-dependent oxidoreductase, partial [Pyrinomonadaceae bacterium]|nr:FAD-dependent oxidoreductase [Pyrinomonadaceae bacterium]